MIQLEVLLVVTQSPGLPLLDEYPTTTPVGMCRDQFINKISATLWGSGRLVHQHLVDLLLRAGVLVLHAVSFLHLFAESNFPYHHRQPHTMSIIFLFILNSRACIEVNNSLAGLLIATVVDSKALVCRDPWSQARYCIVFNVQRLSVSLFAAAIHI